MSLSPETPVHSYIIRGGAECPTRQARLNADLATDPYAHASVERGVPDPRLVDPSLIEAVETERARAREEGREAGYQDGLDQGYADGMARADAERAEMLVRDEAERHVRAQALTELLVNITQSVDNALHRDTHVLDEFERELAEAAVELAEKLVGHHLQVGDCAARDAVQRALASVPRHASVTLYLNPADVADIAVMTEGITDFDVADLVADPGIEPGGARATAHHLTVDAQMSLAIDRVRKALST